MGFKVFTEKVKWWFSSLFYAVLLLFHSSGLCCYLPPSFGRCCLASSHLVSGAAFPPSPFFGWCCFLLMGGAAFSCSSLVVLVGLLLPVSCCTKGLVQMVGEHVVKHTSNLQGATGLSAFECEYSALTHGAAHGLGLNAYMADLGFDMSLQIFSDSSAARAFASRRGLGRQRNTLHVAPGASRCITSHSTEN